MTSRPSSASRTASLQSGARVVDGDRRPELRHALHLGRAAGDADHGRAGVARRLHEQAAQPARGGGDEDDVVRASSGGDLEDRQRRAPGADHRHRGVVGQAVGQRVQGLGLAHGQLGVAAARRAEVRDHPPAQPAARRPRGRRASTTPATSRPGIVGSSGSGSGPIGRPARSAVSIRCTPAAATAMRACPGAGARIVDLLVAQVRGRAEGVQADGVHDGHATPARAPAATGHWT